MVYNLITTERAEEVLDNLAYHLIYRLKNPQAAEHLMDNISNVYDRMEENPYQFPDCRDEFLKSKGYREAVAGNMNYIVIFRIEDNDVYILGVFHDLENYKAKL